MLRDHQSAICHTFVQASFSRWHNYVYWSTPINLTWNWILCVFQQYFTENTFLNTKIYVVLCPWTKWSRPHYFLSICLHCMTVPLYICLQLLPINFLSIQGKVFVFGITCHKCSPHGDEVRSAWVIDLYSRSGSHLGLTAVFCVHSITHNISEEACFA